MKKEEYISAEEYWRRHRIPDEVVYATVLTLIVFIVAIMILAVWSVYQLKNAGYLSNVLGILKSML